MLTRPDAALPVQWQESQELDNWGNPLPERVAGHHRVSIQATRQRCTIPCA